MCYPVQCFSLHELLASTIVKFTAKDPPILVLFQGMACRMENHNGAVTDIPSLLSRSRQGQSPGSFFISLYFLHLQLPEAEVINGDPVGKESESMDWRS